MPRKLTPGEITASVEKIRKTYDEFVHKYFKPRSLRQAFESRYLQALKAGLDISSFLLAEISAIQELIKREEERIQAGPPSPPVPKGPTFADKILEENRARISRYPDVPFDADAGEEVRRMAGALTELARSPWQSLGPALHNTMYAMTTPEMLALDSKLRDLSSSDGREAPQSLTRLVVQLRKFPRNYPAIDREEKDYILEASFLLHDLCAVLERVKRVYDAMPASRRQAVEEVHQHAWGIITDFRLKDLKRAP